MALIATSNYLGFQVRFPRSRIKGQILEQLTDLLGECSSEKLAREQMRQNRMGGNAEQRCGLDGMSPQPSGDFGA